ncbi:MAG: Gldg family protein [Steroidobacterales bacterium]
MPGTRWQKFTFGAGGLLALAVLFLAVVMLSATLLRGMRLDLTQHRLYTLSPGTERVLASLTEPVNLYYYFSRDSAGAHAPLLLPYAAHVREFLEELAARSGGKVHLHLVDPQPFSDDEDRAATLGLQSLPSGGTGATLFFGLAGTNSTDGRAVIPGFQPDREQFLEYDVARLIQQLGAPKRPVIGLMSALRMQGQMDPMTGQPGEPWPIIAQLEELFTLRSLSSEAQSIGTDVDVLMLVHPKNLAPQTLYAIDQFVLRGGRLLLLVDPNSGAEGGGPDLGSASDLKPLLQAWGVDYDPHQVIGDLDRGLEVRTSMDAPPVRHIGILGLRRQDLDTTDVVTASLDSINLATAGFLTQHAGARTTFTPLLSSSTAAAPIPLQRFVGLSDPASLRDGFKPTGQRYTLAARVTGPVESAYPAGPPGAPKPAAGPPTAHLAKSMGPVNIVIIADTDLLLDYMWVQMRDAFGQRVAQAFAGNGDLIANILDNLGGSPALIAIRGRASFSRPFERIETLRRRADDRLRDKALELETQLRQTESKLAELQSQRADQNSLALSADQEQELQRFTAEKVRIRRELRETQHSLNVDIDRLDSVLKVLNMAVAPLIVAVAGALLLGWRRRRQRAGNRR